MARSICIEARLAPMPAMEKAIGLIRNVRPIHEDVYEALKTLEAAYRQAEIVANIERHTDQREITRALLGADVRIG